VEHAQHGGLDNGGLDFLARGQEVDDDEGGGGGIRDHDARARSKAGAILAAAAAREVLGALEAHVGDIVRGAHDVALVQHVTKPRAAPHGRGDGAGVLVERERRRRGGAVPLDMVVAVRGGVCAGAKAGGACASRAREEEEERVEAVAVEGRVVGGIGCRMDSPD
jgi:hypothetical protein